MIAKATDNSGNATTSTAVNVSVTVQNDAGISAIVAPVGTLNVAGTTPSVTLRNFGSNTLTSVQILSKVDAGTNSIFNWTGSLAAGASVNVSLPAITGYSVGNHTFTATTGTVNGVTDANGGNNSSSSNFNYTSCANSDETANNSPATAPILTLNIVKNGQIGAATDVDYYKFTTTTASPKFKITLTNLPADFDIKLYSAKTATTINTTALATSQSSGTANETIVYNTPTSGATYFVKIYGYGSAFSTTACYDLLVQTGSILFKTTALAVNGLRLSEPKPQDELIRVEPMTIYPNPTRDFVNIKFMAEYESSYTLTLVNALGKTVEQRAVQYTQGENFTTLATDNLPQGIYFIRLHNGKASYTQKIIVE